MHFLRDDIIFLNGKPCAFCMTMDKSVFLFYKPQAIALISIIAPL